VLSQKNPRTYPGGQVAVKAMLRGAYFPGADRIRDLGDDRVLSFLRKAEVSPNAANKLPIAGIIVLVDVQGVDQPGGPGRARRPNPPKCGRFF